MQTFKADTPSVHGIYEVDDNGNVLHTPQVWRRFIGRKVQYLEAWIKLHSGTFKQIDNEQKV